MAGGEQRADELLPLVYDELRALARSKLHRERPGQTIQATGLVHEAWLRLAGDGDAGWNSRAHFFGAAALAMRRILVEQARRKRRLRHGGENHRIDVDELDAVEWTVGTPSDDILAVEEAVTTLELQDERKGRIVNLRYFAGLTNEETAAALGVSVGTIEREWRFIKSWLQVQLGA